MLTFVTGRKKSGKTEYVYGVVKDAIEKDEKVFFIVPEQESLVTEREMVSRFGNRVNMNVEVMGFKRLCNRVFRECGGLSQNYIDKCGKLLVMSQAIADVKPSLMQYGDVCETPEFIEKALDAADEFTACAVTVSKLETALDEMGQNEHESIKDKLSDLLYIFSAYKAILKSSYNDGGDDLDRLFELLSRFDYFKDKTVIFDSFYGLTKQELRICEEMISQAQNAYVTLTTDLARENSDFFKRSNDLYSSLSDHCAKCGIKTEKILLKRRTDGKSDVLRLEERFPSYFVDDGNAKEKSEHVTEIICDTRFDEPSAAAALIRKLILQGDVKYREIAVCAGNISAYDGIIDTAFEKCGIPYHKNAKEELTSKPIVAFVLSAFELASTKSRSAMIRHIKTGLCPIDDESLDLYELYIDTWNISGRQLFTDNEWYMPPDGYTESISKSAEKILAGVNRAKSELNSYLSAFFEDIKTSKTVSGYARAVYKLMNCANIRDEDNLYWNMLCDALDKTVDFLKDKVMTAERFCELLTLVISNTETAVIPTTIDEVQLSSISLMRSRDTKCVIILGLNDGIFPALSRDSAILSDNEKKTLEKYGIELYAGADTSFADDLFLAYNAMCAPEKCLFLIRSKKDFDLSHLDESGILSFVKRELDIASLKYPFEDVYDNASSDSSLFSLMYRLGKYTGSLEKYFAEKDGYSKILSAIRASAESKSNIDPELSRRYYGKEINLSPTRLEAYSGCRFSHYCKFTLGLAEHKKAELGGIETGNIVHKVLEIFVRKMATRLGNGMPRPDDDEIMRELHGIFDGYFETITRLGADSSSKRFAYLYKRLFVSIFSVAKYVCDEFEHSKFAPVDFELVVGRGENAVEPYPIEITDSEGRKLCTLKLVGKIDRVDTYKRGNDTYIKIVDYKTGSKSFNLSDVSAGFNLQMLIYLYSIIKNGSGRYGKDIIPAGISYLLVSRPDIALSLGEDVEEIIEKESKKTPTSGLFIDDMDILRAMDNELSGKFNGVKLTKDGRIYEKSPAVSLEKFGKTINDVSKICEKLAYEMISGMIDINPYKCKDKKDSCAFCPMLPVCRYGIGDNGTRYKLDDVLSKEAQ